MEDVGSEKRTITRFKPQDEDYPVKQIIVVTQGEATLANLDGEEYGYAGEEDFVNCQPALGDEVVPGYDQDYDYAIISRKDFEKIAKINPNRLTDENVL